MNKVEELFKNKLLFFGGVMLLSKNNAIRFIIECKNENIRILGIDSFLLVDDKIQPSLDNSIDLSRSTQTNTETCDAALDFVNSIDERFHFEIVCE